jgi:hypothetical protein
MKMFRRYNICVLNRMTVYRENVPGSETGSLKFGVQMVEALHMRSDCREGDAYPSLPATSLAGTMGPSYFHLFGTHMEHLTGK